MSKEIPLIGIPMPKILELKLPTLKEVMCVFFHQLQVLKYSVKQSAKNTVDQVVKLWKNNEIPTCSYENSVKKILRCHDKWLKITKNLKRKKSPAQKKSNQHFRMKSKFYLTLLIKNL